MSQDDSQETRRRRAALSYGQAAEAWVTEQLVREGWTLLARNWRGGGGELDVVAVRDARLRFVEVKARGEDADEAEADGLDAVTPDKRRKLVGAARAWMRAHDDTPFDEAAFLLAVVVAPDPFRGTPPEVVWFDDPFDGS